MPTVPKVRTANRRHAPGLGVERELWGSGHEVVVGIDEVGRGSWAGPLTVAAAVVPQDRRVYKIRDSKMLTESEREAIFDRVVDWVDRWGIGHASNAECDELGMAAAQRLAADRALQRLDVVPDAILVDGNWDFVGRPGVRLLVKGDRTSLSIATASIVAKVTRDRIMRRLAPHYPGYNFESNKGYPCPTHRAAIAAWGPSAIHRRSWVFMESMPWGIPRHRRVEQLTLDGI
ncbi:MAG: ribonuclease HII [Acidimicrobiia bacterium]|jgi:ribonuclease HII